MAKIPQLFNPDISHMPVELFAPYFSDFEPPVPAWNALF